MQGCCPRVSGHHPGEVVRGEMGTRSLSDTVRLTLSWAGPLWQIALGLRDIQADPSTSLAFQISPALSY